VSDIAIEKRLTIVRRSASHAVLDALRPMCSRLVVCMLMHWHLGHRTPKRYNDLNAIGKPLILSQTTKIKHYHQ
ncbi:hypothetical protein, partial [Pseudomonas syringae group genomosp. 3]|uniref:hypothetical protein n=1 Tax=Pseudomonas syringae group genomosp. 3 TaxID=251701 RepID=UPI000EFF6B6B